MTVSTTSSGVDAVRDDLDALDPGEGIVHLLHGGIVRCDHGDVAHVVVWADVNRMDLPDLSTEGADRGECLGERARAAHRLDSEDLVPFNRNLAHEQDSAEGPAAAIRATRKTGTPSVAAAS
jgi:hypothetical protein